MPKLQGKQQSFDHLDDHSNFEFMISFFFGLTKTQFTYRHWHSWNEIPSQPQDTLAVEVQTSINFQALDFKRETPQNFGKLKWKDDPQKDEMMMWDGEQK